MKLKLCMALCGAVACLSLWIAFAPTAHAKQAEYGQVTTDQANLRQKPSTSDDTQILAKLPLNAEVEVLEAQDGWYRVVFEDTIGYVHQDMLFVNAIGNRVARVNDDGVKLRGGPGKTAYVVDELAGGTGVKVKRMVGEWYFVNYNGKSGYIHKSVVTMTRATGAAANERLLKRGMQGQEVKKLQQELVRRDFLLKDDVTGLYGAKTAEAVAQFQRLANLGADGTAGEKTFALLYDPNNRIKNTPLNAITGSSAIRAKGKVLMVDWFKVGTRVIPRGSVFTVYDPKTKLSFRVKRSGGTFHSDTSPLTAKDTAIFKRIVGKWTWNRRAIWVIAPNGNIYAASMNSYPHSPDPIKNDNFPGHFCIHMVNSKIHKTGRVDSAHQSCVRKAFSMG